MKSDSSTAINSFDHYHESPRLTARLEEISPIRKETRPQTQISSSKSIGVHFNEDFKRAPSIKDIPSAPLEFKQESPSVVFEELYILQQQINEINSKLKVNIKILRDKQEKNEELKGIINSIEKRTVTTNMSLGEAHSNCVCVKGCFMF